MHLKQNISPVSKTFLPHSSTTSTPCTQSNYKQRASVLFDKLNTFKTSLQQQKQSQFSQILQQIHQLQQTLSVTSSQKQHHFQEVIASLTQINKQLSHNKTQYERFHLLLNNIIENTNRQCQLILTKMNKEKQNNQDSIEKYIDFKIESYVLKNKGVWLQQDLIHFQTYKEQLTYIKNQIKLFYKNQQKQTDKLKKEVSESLEKQKLFLLQQINRSDHQDIMTAIEAVYSEIRKKLLI